MLAGIERTAKAVAAMSNAPEPVITITARAGGCRASGRRIAPGYQRKRVLQ
jgi:hypothetical protein